jgi:hypothetical protein
VYRKEIFLGITFDVLTYTPPTKKEKKITEKELYIECAI